MSRNVSFVFENISLHDHRLIKTILKSFFLFSFQIHIQQLFSFKNINDNQP